MITTYEVKVWYTGDAPARFVEQDFEKALKLATSLQELPSAERVVVNEITIDSRYEWRR